MPRLPVVAIIGKPNSGKSTLFNKLIGERIAIVSEVPGTTRDHIAHRIETEELDYLLLDTGGIGGGTEDTDMEDDVQAQSLLAVEGADLIIFTLSSREEITASDLVVRDVLWKKRRSHVPVLVAVTKCDNDAIAEEVLPRYHELRIGDEVLPVSAFQGSGIGELEEMIVERLRAAHFEKTERKPEEEAAPRIAIIGKPNVGKSSIVNALMSDTQRTLSPRLVSDIPGTTRDVTDTVIRHEEHEYVLVDTAGLKRQARVDEGIEHFAMLRTIQALQACDIAVLVLDATQPISKQDKRIAGMAAESGKGMIVLLNKMDLLTSEQKKEKAQEVTAQFLFCRFASVIHCSAKTRDGLLKLFALIDKVIRNIQRRIQTKDLHRWYQDTIEGRPVGALAHCKHITQAEDIPPTFVLFVRDPKQVKVSQLRFIENRMRETFDFEGVPLRWVTKKTGGRLS